MSQTARIVFLLRVIIYSDDKKTEKRMQTKMVINLLFFLSKTYKK